MHPAHMTHLVTMFGHAAHLAMGKTQAESARHRLVALQAQIEHETRMAETHASLARDRMEHDRHALEVEVGLLHQLVSALIEKRVEAVQSGFTAVLSGFADQARHYMSQQEKVLDAQLKETDPHMAARYRARLVEIDGQLSRIRQDAHRLYCDMTKTILIIGGNHVPVSSTDQTALKMLPPVLA